MQKLEIKVIPQKKSSQLIFLKVSLNVLHQALFREKKTIKMIGQYSRLRDMMGQSYPFMLVLVLITRIIHRFTLNFAVARNILC